MKLSVELEGETDGRWIAGVFTRPGVLTSGAIRTGDD